MASTALPRRRPPPSSPRPPPSPTLPPPPLLRLPPELLAHVVDQLETRAQLALARSCGALAAAARRGLYRQVAFSEAVDRHLPYEYPRPWRDECEHARHREHEVCGGCRPTAIADLAAFARTLRSSAALAARVRSASFAWASVQGSAVHEHVVAALERLSPHGAQLHLAPPFLLTRGYSRVARPRWGPLTPQQLLLPRLLHSQRLTSLDLQAAHLAPCKGKRAADCRPTLRDLLALATLQALTLDFYPPHEEHLLPTADQDDADAAPRTPARLAHLAITDYSGDARDLAELLRWPRALKSLRLSLWSTPMQASAASSSSDIAAGAIDPAELRALLAPQAAALVSLDVSYLDFDAFSAGFPPDDCDGGFRDFRDFTALQQLALPYEFFVRGRLNASVFGDPRTEAHCNEWRTFFGGEWECGPGADALPPLCDTPPEHLLDDFPPTLRHLQIQSCYRPTYYLGRKVQKTSSRDCYRMLPLLQALPLIKTAVLPRLESVEVWERSVKLNHRSLCVGMVKLSGELGELEGVREAGVAVNVTVHSQSPMSTSRLRSLGGWQGPPRLRR